MKTLLLLLLALNIYGSDKIFIMTESYHTGPYKYLYNNHNYGLGYEKTFSNNLGFQVGAYRNSHYKNTIFIGGHYEYLLMQDLAISTSVSYVTNYNYTSCMALVGVQYKFIRLVFAPEVGNYDGVINLQLVFKLYQ